jgi:hypothetical protein
MATKSRNPANTFNFMRLRRITGGVVGDLPVIDFDPINLAVILPPIYARYFGTTTLTDISAFDPTTGTLVQNTGYGETSIPWSGEGVRLWAWFDDIVETKTIWSDPSNAINNGIIGGSNDLFLAPIAKTVNGRTGKFYITEFSTFGRILKIS